MVVFLKKCSNIQRGTILYTCINYGGKIILELKSSFQIFEIILERKKHVGRIKKKFASERKFNGFSLCTENIFKISMM